MSEPCIVAAIPTIHGETIVYEVEIDGWRKLTFELEADGSIKEGPLLGRDCPAHHYNAALAAVILDLVRNPLDKRRETCPLRMERDRRGNWEPVHNLCQFPVDYCECPRPLQTATEYQREQLQETREITASN